MAQVHVASAGISTQSGGVKAVDPARAGCVGGLGTLLEAAWVVANNSCRQHLIGAALVNTFNDIVNLPVAGCGRVWLAHAVAHSAVPRSSRVVGKVVAPPHPRSRLGSRGLTVSNEKFSHGDSADLRKAALLRCVAAARVGTVDQVATGVVGKASIYSQVELGNDQWHAAVDFWVVTVMLLALG